MGGGDLGGGRARGGQVGGVDGGLERTTRARGGRQSPEASARGGREPAKLEEDGRMGGEQ